MKNPLKEANFVTKLLGAIELQIKMDLWQDFCKALTRTLEATHHTNLMNNWLSALHLFFSDNGMQMWDSFLSSDSKNVIHPLDDTSKMIAFTLVPEATGHNII